MAAAMQENGTGSVLTIDSNVARSRKPDILTLMEQTGLTDRITPVFADRSYTWELMKLIQKYTENGKTTPQFDFVFIDGGHTWDSDGFSFLLADKLLRPGGWVLFDDVTWTPSECAGEAWVEEMPIEEQNVAHVEKIFNLLVIPNPSYENLEFDGTWAWARKRSDATTDVDRGDLVANIYRKTNAARRSFLVRRYIKKLLRI
jgi:predicted O-methyltransferase YrrM